MYLTVKVKELIVPGAVACNWLQLICLKASTVSVAEATEYKAVPAVTVIVLAKAGAPSDLKKVAAEPLTAVPAYCRSRTLFRSRIGCTAGMQQ